MRHVTLIARKELLETVRDRRTLFISFVLPLLLYPALLLGLTQVIGATQRNLEEERQRIAVLGEPEGSGLSEELRRKNLDAGGAGGLEDLLRRALDEGDARDEALRMELRDALKRAGLRGALLFPGDVPEKLREYRRASARLLFDSTDEPSRVARGKALRAIDAWLDVRREEAKRGSPVRSLLEFIERPLAVEEVEIASSRQRGAYSFAPMLGLIIVLMCLTGAFYPAVDLAAGEKERGTMETLLVSPVSRVEIVLGKFLAIWAVAVATALLNLVVMGITFSKLASMVQAGKIAFSIPLSAMGGVTAILVPTAALFSALALALSSFATSYKEGQHYLSPLFLVAMPLAMVGLLPNVHIGYGLALVPVANVVLLVKAMLLGGEAVAPALLAAAATAGYAAVALFVAVRIFRRESVLFRAGAGRSFDVASLRAARMGLPTEGFAVLLFFVVLALMFFLSGEAPETLGGAVKVFFLSQGAAVLLPTLLFARIARLRAREVFALRGFRPALAPLLPLLGASAALVILWIHANLLPARDPQGFERVIGMLREGPAILGIFLLAVLPPVCEEALCRGFLFSAFEARHGARKAILATAALFGALHLDLYRLPATFLGGLLLGFVRFRTGSLLASILVHASYNGLVAAAVYLPSLDRALAAAIEGPAVAAAAAALAFGLLLLRGRPRGD